MAKIVLYIRGEMTFQVEGITWTKMRQSSVLNLVWFWGGLNLRVKRKKKCEAGHILAKNMDFLNYMNLVSESTCNNCVILDNVLTLTKSPGGSESKESVCNSGDPGSTPESGRSLGERNGNPLQYSCLGNTRDRLAWLSN